VSCVPSSRMKTARSATLAEGRSSLPRTTPAAARASGLTPDPRPRSAPRWRPQRCTHASCRGSPLAAGWLPLPRTTAAAHASRRPLARQALCAQSPIRSRRCRIRGTGGPECRKRAASDGDTIGSGKPPSRVAPKNDFDLGDVVALPTVLHFRTDSVLCRSRCRCFRIASELGKAQNQPAEFTQEFGYH